MYHYHINLINLFQAFQLVDKGAFCQLLMFTQTKIHQEILIQAHAAEVKVHEALAKIEGKVSFTFDTWTSDAHDPYLSIMGHHITAPEG